MKKELSFKEIELSVDNNAIDKNLFIPPRKRTFGSSPDIEFKNIKVRIGNKPIAFDLKKLYELREKKVPEYMDIFDAYDIWMINYYISIVDTDALRNVSQFGFITEYDSKIITILDTMPQTKFTKVFGGSASFEADLSLTGSFSIPDTNINLTPTVENLAFGGKIKLAGNLEVIGRIDFNVFTTDIVATGKGSSNGEWVFNKSEYPLNGDQNMVHVILTPKNQKQIKIKTEIYSTIRTALLIPTRLKSSIIDIEIPL